MNAKKLFLLGFAISALSASHDQENINSNNQDNNRIAHSQADRNVWRVCDSADNPSMCESINYFWEHYQPSQKGLFWGIPNLLNQMQNIQLPVKK